MNFTREPILETIISAKDGYKLSIKSSKGNENEEYLVDAVEVVSFGGSFFYRCQERPKTFFIPAGDFEIVEVKETRILIKNPNIDKNIKIAGGNKEQQKQTKPEDQIAKDAPKYQEQKRDKKKGRRNKPKTVEADKEETKEAADKSKAPATPTAPAAQDGKAPEQPKPSVFSHLLTPPTGLISDSLEKYKQESAPETLTLNAEKDKPVKKMRGVAKKTKVKEEAPEESNTAAPSETKATPSEEAKPEAKPEAKEDLKPPELVSEKAPAVSGQQEEKITSSEPPKPGEQLEEKEVSAESFVKATSEEESK